MIYNQITILGNRDEVIDTTSIYGSTVIVNGGATFSTDVSITDNGSPQEGAFLDIFYLGAGTDVDGNILDILGRDLTTFATENLRVTAFYKGGQWETFVTKLNSTVLETDSIDTDKIQDGAVTEDKIADNSVTEDKLTTGNLPRIIPVEIDMSTAALKDLRRSIRIPFKFKIVSIGYELLEAMPTDGASIEIDVGTNLSSTAIITAGTLVGSRVVASGGSVESSGADWLTITPTKTTAEGKVLFSIAVQKVA